MRFCGSLLLFIATIGSDTCIDAMAPTQKELIEKLQAENSELKRQLQRVTERLDKLEANQTESLVRIEGVEDNLCQVTAEQQQLQEDQAGLMLTVECQQMYTRKQTLLLTGDAVQPPSADEDTRKYVLQLIKDYLGITGIQPDDICACHRLRNKKVILVRFLALHNNDRVYRARTKPKQKGLIIHESLTAERMSVVNMLKDLKKEENPPLVSYFTQGGKMLVRTSEDRDTALVEIPVGVTKEQIRSLCLGKKVTVTSLQIRNQFRSVHTSSGNPSGKKRADGQEADWQTAQKKKSPKKD